MIHIVIPTLNREEKLLKCLGSIQEAKKQVDSYLYTFVYFTDKKEFEDISYKLTSYPWILTKLIDKYDVGSFWNNHCREYDFDILFYLNDDILLSPDCLSEAINSMKLHFPKLDGIIGLNQENLPKNQCVETAFGVVGREYINRFPNKNFFCPKYYRFFADQEIAIFSNKIGKLYWEEKAKLIHCHPAFDSKYLDDTHTEVRKYWKEDKKTYDNRKKRKLLWGESFEI